MGREAVATCHWQGQIAEAKLHLDAQTLSLRGDIRADLPRRDISDIHALDNGVHLTCAGQPLILEFNAKEAAAWVKALLKTPPTLAEKLGLTPNTPAFVTGETTDTNLQDALAGRTTRNISEAAFLLCTLLTPQDIDAALTLGQAHPGKHLWAVYAKGKSDLSGNQIRSAARQAGFIDSKSCAVSDRLTATRYRQQ